MRRRSAETVPYHRVELEDTFPGCLAEGDEEEGDLEEAAVSATPVPRFAAI